MKYLFLLFLISCNSPLNWYVGWFNDDKGEIVYSDVSEGVVSLDINKDWNCIVFDPKIINKDIKENSSYSIRKIVCHNNGNWIDKMLICDKELEIADKINIMLDDRVVIFICTAERIKL